jgi:hypothetical protein
VMEQLGHGSRYGIREDSLREVMVTHGLLPYSYLPRERSFIRFEEGAPNTGNSVFARDIDFLNQRVASAPKYRVHGTEI